MEESEGFEIKFWKDWLNADLLEREKLVAKLPFVKEVPKIHELPKHLQEHAIVIMLNGFFEDLENAVYTKIRLENSNKKK